MAPSLVWCLSVVDVDGAEHRLREALQLLRPLHLQQQPVGADRVQRDDAVAAVGLLDEIEHPAGQPVGVAVLRGRRRRRADADRGGPPAGVGLDLAAQVLGELQGGAVGLGVVPQHDDVVAARGGERRATPARPGALDSESRDRWA